MTRNLRIKPKAGIAIPLATISKILGITPTGVETINPVDGTSRCIGKHPTRIIVKIGGVNRRRIIEQIRIIIKRINNLRPGALDGQTQRQRQ